MKIKQEQNLLKKGTSILIAIGFMANVSAARAEIVFQDDDFSVDYSQGFNFNADDAGDENVTLKLGNDGTDGTIIWDDGASELQFGDGIDSVSVNSATWDISAAGVASGLTGISSTGVVNFSGATSFRMREVANEAAANCATVNEVVLDTTEGKMYICTGTGEPGTWSSTVPSASDFEAVYAADAGSNLTTSNGNFTVTSGTGDFIVDSNDWNVTAAGGLDAATISASGDITTSGGTFVVGTTALNETTSPTDSGAFLVGVNDEFANTTATNVQDVLDDFDALIGSAAPNNSVLKFYPEFQNAVVFQDGSTNQGLLEAFYDNTNDEHYYRWSSQQIVTQDIDVKFRFSLPADFSAVGDFTFRFRTGTVTEADNDLEIYFYNATDETTGDPTLCASDTTNVSTTWATGTITAATLNAGCTAATALNAGDVIEIDVKFYDNAGVGDFSNVGYLQLDYTN